MTTNVQKFILLVLIVLGTEDVSSSFYKRQGSGEIDFVDMKDGCVKRTEEQIRMEIGASMKYLSMATFFSQEDVNRPGFARLFFDAASEERQHAMHLVNYLKMRGRYMNDGKGTPTKFVLNITALVSDAMKATVLGMGNQLRSLVVGKDEEKNTTSGLIGLQNALKMEVTVTKSIRELIKKCENEMMYHDYHFVDVLTSDFLDEQYRGQRVLAGQITTLGKMVDSSGAQLGELLFDKELLK